MTKFSFHKLLPALLPLLLAGCAASTPASSTASTARKPGEGKGHWVVENAPQTGSMQPKRYWVSEEPDAAASTASNGSGVNTYGNRSIQPSFGSTTGLSNSGGAGGGGGIGGFGGAGGR